MWVSFSHVLSSGLKLSLFCNLSERVLRSDRVDCFRRTVGGERRLCHVRPEGVAEAVGLCLSEESPTTSTSVKILETVLDPAILQRIDNGLVDLGLRGARWSVASAGGVTSDGRRVSCLYAKLQPSFPVSQSYAPLAAVDSDVLLLTAEAATRAVRLMQQTQHSCGFGDVAVLAGYACAQVSLFAPFLSIGIDGAPLPKRPWDAVRSASLLGAIAAHLGLNAVSPASDQIRRVVASQCDPLSLSIVVRTQFSRPHLLPRALRSIVAARRESPLEVVLASDVDETVLADNIFRLQSEFLTISLRAVWSERSERPSRIVNLLAGIRAATQDYVMVLDDDDYLDELGLAALATATFLGARPLVFVTHAVHDEVWGGKAPDSSRLLHSKIRHTLPATGWKFMFHGYNQISSCGAAIPRDFLGAAIEEMPLNYDLSEDYALYLFLLARRNLPEIVEVRDVVAHQSIRESDTNSVTTEDLTGWTHDMAGHLYDVTRSASGASAGQWQLRAAQGQAAKIERAAARQEVEALRRKVAELNGVIDAMTNHIRDLVGQEEAARTPVARLVS